MNTYIHKTEKRLRVRSDFIKSHPEDVEKLIADLKEIDAVKSIKHKKYAGSVAILFDHNELDCESLLEILESHNWTKSAPNNLFIENAAVNGTKSLVKGAATIAFSRLIVPSVTKLICV
ncbi:hypothetical protein L3Q72_17515 [Vibrio sp. JC009]|uniref:HMA2 domain-containing protein n=1 Tax=Vibrio sp. JC009 TaxID=2912314 RepID=UPI0023B13B27|nr:hypothetical protein [Vibrio sp. JC009]WED24674.1 hypothetical protein L3Q72_17515 [Vibrio sp. JC009]